MVHFSFVRWGEIPVGPVLRLDLTRGGGRGGGSPPTERGIRYARYAFAYCAQSFFSIGQFPSAFGARPYLVVSRSISSAKRDSGTDTQFLWSAALKVSLCEYCASFGAGLVGPGLLSLRVELRAKVVASAKAGRHATASVKL
jgi:hypothetical protein